MQTKILLMLSVVLLFVGCKGVQPTTPTQAHTETKIEYRDRIVKDTIYVQDSIVIRQAGDTIYKDRIHREYIEKLRIDTAYIEHNDSIYIDRVQYIERKRTTYDKITSAGFWLLLILIIDIIYLLIRK